MRFQPGEGPRGLLCDCEIFANLQALLGTVWMSSRSWTFYGALFPVLSLWFVFVSTTLCLLSEVRINCRVNSWTSLKLIPKSFGNHDHFYTCCGRMAGAGVWSWLGSPLCSIYQHLAVWHPAPAEQLQPPCHLHLHPPLPCQLLPHSSRQRCRCYNGLLQVMDWLFSALKNIGLKWIWINH